MKKNVKILSLIMAIVMVFSIFTVSVVAGDNDYTRYVTKTGSATQKGTKSNPWSLDFLASENVVASLNEKIAPGDRTGVIINVSQEDVYDQTLVLNGIKGTATTPVTVVCNYNAGALDGLGSNSNLNTPQGNGIEIVNCTYVTVQNIDVCAVEGCGILIRDSSNISIENVNSFIENQSVTKTMNNPIKFEGTNKNISVQDCAFSYVTAPIKIDASVEGFSYENGSVQYSTDAALVIDSVNGLTLDGFVAKAAYFDPENEEAQLTDKAAVIIKNSNAVTFSGAKITDCAGSAISLVNSTGCVVENVFSYNNASFMVNELSGECGAIIRFCISSLDNKLPTVISTDDASGLWVINNTFYKPASIDLSKLQSSVIANNIYDMELLGEVKINSNNVFKTNCYHNTFKNKDDDAIMKNPQFSATAMTGAEMSEFILDDDSIIIGAGTDLKAFMGEKDMFGNVIPEANEHNIGAYDGIGVQVKQADEVNQTKDTIGFYIAVVRHYVDAVVGKFIPPAVQEAVSNFLLKAVSDIVGAIGRLFNK